MVNVLKFKIQLTILSILSLLFAYVWVFHPATEATNYLDVSIEGTMTASCLFMMLSAENLKGSREMYWIFLVSSSLLFMGHFLDLIDELTMTLPILDILEGIFKPSGILLLLAGTYRWVEFQNKQSQLMRHLAEIDPLTGLLNRRALTDKATSLIQRSRRDTRQISVIIFDIDHFKRVNDSFGHLFGDQVLVDVATTIKSILQENSYFARLGGEEFIVLLGDTSTKQATRIAEEIRTSVEMLKISHNHQKVTCTVSLGIATDYVSDGGIETLIEQADKSLYEAKALGRNCWRVAQ
ncbi:GGDEF domain-containing protein [Photobacterium sp. SDRW27]|uniref:GGDEF domain-containing protein n=1 Tax=Photobacterium obscurum TaxID=2829490 RepID=UPI002243A119|nr:GGDEF domain-containing protein [Photobacterium obscurum]MCW8327670.1 GGDEF domain-containing protein [Photobacterium obscurum]